MGSCLVPIFSLSLIISISFFKFLSFPFWLSCRKTRNAVSFGLLSPVWGSIVLARVIATSLSVAEVNHFRP